jgi:hypothetical protein
MTDRDPNQHDSARGTRTDEVVAAPALAAEVTETTEPSRPRHVTEQSTSTEEAVVRDGLRQRNARADRLGGIRWGAVFFGWLCATGVAVLLVTIVAATGTAIGLTGSTVDDVVDGAVDNAGAVSLGGAVALVVVLGVSSLAGGYVASRMARFGGRTQGFAVWVVGLVVSLLVALGGVVLGAAYDVLARLDLPRFPVDEGTATVGGVLTLLSILVVTLIAAVLGGGLGDRYHRRLDEIDLR